jgi:hypothetical protein
VAGALPTEAIDRGAKRVKCGGHADNARDLTPASRGAEYSAGHANAATRKPAAGMTEFEIYLPTTRNDGTSINLAVIDKLKQKLARAFGGYTHLQQRSEGVWSMGGVMFRDEVTKLEADLEQESVLIVAREVRVVS